jgi:hypothetical protein
VGSLTAKIKMKGSGLLSVFEQIIMSDAPIAHFKEFARALEKEAVWLYPSKKHMVNRDLCELRLSPALKYQRAA